MSAQIPLAPNLSRRAGVDLRLRDIMLGLFTAPSAFQARPLVWKPCTRPASALPVAMNGGKGFGGGEATRDPAPTFVDPSDPKGKQQAIHKAESFAEYLAKRK